MEIIYDEDFLSWADALADKMAKYMIAKHKVLQLEEDIDALLHEGMEDFYDENGNPRERRKSYR